MSSCVYTVYVLSFMFLPPNRNARGLKVLFVRNQQEELTLLSLRLPCFIDEGHKNNCLNCIKPGIIVVKVLLAWLIHMYIHVIFQPMKRSQNAIQDILTVVQHLVNGYRHTSLNVLSQPTAQCPGGYNKVPEIYYKCTKLSKSLLEQLCFKFLHNFILCSCFEIFR